MNSLDNKYEVDSDTERNCSISSQPDPKNIQDLSIHVMSNGIVWKLSVIFLWGLQIQYVMHNVQNKFDQMANRVGVQMEDIGQRVDDLERTIADVMSQSGIDLTLWKSGQPFAFKKGE